MANWTNDKFKTWLKEIDAPSLSQEQLKKEAIVFSEYFAEVDKRRLQKLLMILRKSTNKCLQMFHILYLKKWVVKSSHSFFFLCFLVLCVFISLPSIPTKSQLPHWTLGLNDAFFFPCLFCFAGVLS